MFQPDFSNSHSLKKPGQLFDAVLVTVAGAGFNCSRRNIKPAFSQSANQFIFPAIFGKWQAFGLRGRQSVNLTSQILDAAAGEFLVGRSQVALVLPPAPFE